MESRRVNETVNNGHFTTKVQLHSYGSLDFTCVHCGEGEARHLGLDLLVRWGAVVLVGRIDVLFEVFPLLLLEG